jgi:hypothetical protein
MKIIKTTCAEYELDLSRNDLLSLARQVDPTIPVNAKIKIRGPGKYMDKGGYEAHSDDGRVTFTWNENPKVEVKEAKKT